MQKFKTYNYEADGCCLKTFGVLLEADAPEEAIRRYLTGETVFWNNWRGSFFGLLIDTINGITLLFNDHIGSKMVFYTQSAEGLVWDTNLFDLAQTIGANADNENYLWQMLIYGYSPVGETVFKAIHRLQAGEYVCAKKGKVEKHIYHRFDNTPNSLSIEENIERIDTAFRHAIERVILKNEEYEYTHFIPLSAGLDSRMVNCVAHEIAKTPIHTITYSQSNYFDETTPKELSAYWNYINHFTPLDSGECLLLLDEASRMTSGLVQYSGAAETLYGLPEIAKQQAGIFLTGMAGDIIVGTAYTRHKSNQTYHIGDGALLPIMHLETLRRALPSDFEQLYSNREIFYLYVRAFNCANLGSPLIHQQFGESYSPFCDVDVLKAAYAAPLEQRWNHRLYDQWILTKYPDIAKWKHNGVYTIGHRPYMVSISNHMLPLQDLPKRAAEYILKRLHVLSKPKETIGHSMNPEDDWFMQNETLRTWAEKYIQTNLELLNNYPEVQQIAQQLSKGNANERMQVMSLLACLRQAR